MPNGQPRRSLDATRARELFGFEARTSLRDGLERTIAWYRELAQPSARSPRCARACGARRRCARRCDAEPRTAPFASSSRSSSRRWPSAPPRRIGRPDRRRRALPSRGRRLRRSSRSSPTASCSPTTAASSTRTHCRRSSASRTRVFALGVAAAVAVALAAGVFAAAGGVAGARRSPRGLAVRGRRPARPGFHESVWSVTLARVAPRRRHPRRRVTRAAPWAGDRRLAPGGDPLGRPPRLHRRGLLAVAGGAAPAGALVLSSLALLVPRLRPAKRRAPAPSEH